MVKKIGGAPPSIPTTRTTSIDSTKAVSSAKVGNVSNLGEASRVNKFRSPTREITPELKKQLFQMIEDEAEKILTGDGISEKRKAKVKTALRMAIESGNEEKEKKES